MTKSYDIDPDLVRLNADERSVILRALFAIRPYADDFDADIIKSLVERLA